MIHERISLRKDKPTVYMETYIIDKPMEDSKKYPTVVICPGGGYAFCSPREAEPIAFNFNAAGFNAVVVYYSVYELYPTALQDLSEAVVTVRENAEAWNVDTDKVFVCGFSAGGHLAASLGTLWNSEPTIKREDGMNKPNGMILCYPVITSGDKCHAGSIEVITNGDKALVEQVSLEKQVTPDCPPTFIWHTFGDAAVPVENTLYFLEALSENGISAEAHIYPRGGHGLSLANEYVCLDENCFSEVQDWMRHAVRWIKSL
ncbi:MAG: alpha/beta hydrolase [Clostridia bacterium]|nr:alpha/beta hydrolase [Clostridia bacterium]